MAGYLRPPYYLGRDGKSIVVETNGLHSRMHWTDPVDYFRWQRENIHWDTLAETDQWHATCDDMIERLKKAREAEKLTEVDGGEPGQ